MLDPNSIQRIELAGVLMDMAGPLGKPMALELVFPTVSQLLEGGEEMCGLLEQEATLTMALLTIAVGRTRYGRTTMAVRR